MYNASQQKEIEIKNDYIYFKGHPIISCKDFFSNVPAFFTSTSVDIQMKLVIENNRGPFCTVLTYQQFLNNHRVRVAELFSKIS